MALEFFLNGELVKENNSEPTPFLADYLRRKIGLTGTKVACGEGGCGSCTVLLSSFDKQTQIFSHRSVNACITPVWSIHSCHILTVEGLRGKPKSCHILQDAIATGNGTQCGFCTPGMVMSAHALLCKKSNPGLDDIKDALQGNLCRCTGYRPILEAFQKCSEIAIEDLPKCTPCLEDKRVLNAEAGTNTAEIELLLKEYHETGTTFKGVQSWRQPTSLQELLDILEKNRNYRLIGGSTEIAAIGSKLSPFTEETEFVSTKFVAEMQVMKLDYAKLRLGAALTISEMVAKLDEIITTGGLQPSQTRSFRTIMKLMEKFGSVQIRNVATVGGSIVTRNPASDIQTLLEALNCRIEFYETLSGSQIKSYLPLRDISLSGEKPRIIVAVDIPFTTKFQVTWADKVTKRSVNDGALINFATTITLNSNLEGVDNIFISMGGKAIQRFQLHLDPETGHTGINNDEFLNYLMVIVEQNLVARRAQDTNYCKTLAKNLCIKCCNWLKTVISAEDLSPVPELKTTTIKSCQTFDKVSGDQPDTDLIGRPVPHASAYKHATGEAKFVDDMPKLDKELELAFVLSERPHAKIKNVDYARALAVEGVMGFVNHNDISSPEKNFFGLVVKDEEIFASEKVNCVGQVIGGIVAKSRDIAIKAVKLVNVEYEDIQPCIITIEDAIKHKSYYENFEMLLENGDCNQNFNGSTKLDGSFEIGSQAHFYMETQGCLAIPNGEDGEMEIISSTQNPMDTQSHVANTLDVPANRVVVKVKRVGGGFGGKESRSLLVALPAAVAAKKFGVPVRCILDRRTDMLISGKRNPFKVQFSVTFNQDGRIDALDITMYVNAGHSVDVSNAALERAIINVDNCYNFPNFKGKGFLCKSNLVSNTVFRGTGAPQAALIAEHILDLVASHLGRDPANVRRINLYYPDDVTPYGQILSNSTVLQCWTECYRMSDYEKRLAKIEEFNANNKWKKRGISINPAQYGVAYTALFLNQASALIHIYRDGSVLLSHGGVEIGQGLHSKMIQVATRELGISSDKIRILETATDKVPNATPTSASSSSDLNGMAVIDACKKLMKTLEPYRTDSNTTWEEMVLKAYMERNGLSATGFYRTPGIGWNEKTMKGSPFNYYSTGTSCTEVELDCLTGQHQILRTDIVMDVGQSLNPAIDLGQIEGAFMQGVGFFTIEDLQFGSNGEVETLGPNTYKIPTASDIPHEFNVSLLSGSSNPRAVYSSKAVGEPPLLLATSAFFSIKDAIRRSRPGTSKQVFELNSPATVERILLALQG